MPPVIAGLGAVLAGTAGGFAVAFAAAGGWVAVGTFVLTQVVLFGVSKLLAPKQNRSGDRQADTMTLSLGEQPREVVVGQIATGGQLVDCWNHDSGSGPGTKNRSEVLVIKISDVPCEDLLGMIVNDEYIAFSGDGMQTNGGLVSGALYVWWRDGSTGQTPPSTIVTNAAGKWPSTKTMAGCAHVFVEYRDKQDRTIWPGGRPRFAWVVKGAKLYDPRKDSSVAGGSGSHDIDDPTTWEWSDNAYLIRYNWVRGFFNHEAATPQLMVGRGLTADEAPPERAIARANVCDESVTLKAGGSEARYRAGGIIKSTDTGIEVEEWLAAAMGGTIVDRDGVVDIDPGEAQSEVFDITDDDLLVDQDLAFSPYLTEDQMVNTVVARFIDPSQRYADVSAPMRRDYADVISDGRVYEEALDLPFVLSGTQAQRIGEIKRRQGRLWRTFQVTLGPRFIGLESGDWGTFTSDRYTGGDTVTVVVNAVSLGADFKVSLVLREIAASVYDWTAATDELTPGSVVIDSTPSPDPIEVVGFAATPRTIATSAGSVPAIEIVWDEFTDAAVTGLEVQVRKDGETEITPTLIADDSTLLAYITSGVGAKGDFQIRARARTNTPGRECDWTDWEDVTTGGSSFDNGIIEERSPNLVFFSPAVAGTNGYGFDPGSGTGFAASTGTTSGKRWVKYAGSFTAGSQYAAMLTAYGYRFKIQAGKRYSIQCEAEATGPVANLQFVVYWYLNGVYVSQNAVQTRTGTQTFGTAMQGFITAPSSGVDEALLVLSLVSNGSGAASFSMIQPDMSLVGPDRTTHPPFAPGRNAYDAADVTASNTAAAITGQKSGATTQFTTASSAPGSPATGDWWLDTTTTVPILKRYDGSSWVATNPDSAYVSTGGQIIDYRGLPANATGPYGITRSVSDVIGTTIPTTQITIVSHTVYAPGGSISVTGGTITGLTASTVYDCFWRMSNSTLSAEVAGSTAANQKRANPDYLWLATGEPGASANEAQGVARVEYGNYL